VRELKNVVERAVYRSDSARIHEVDFDPFRSTYSRRQEEETQEIASPTTEDALPDLMKMPLKKAVRQLERHMLTRALIATQYNQKKAAGLLGLTYDQFRGVYRRQRSHL
jgi:psp operon transcriptional activator